MTVTNCNQLIMNGVHLADLDQIRNSVLSAARMYAQNNSMNLYPNAFMCSHCGQAHSLTPEEIRDIMFHGPGSGDFQATYDQINAMLNNTVPSAAGSGLSNGISGGSDIELAHIMNPGTAINTPVDPDPVIEDVDQADNVETIDHDIVVETGGS